MQPVSSFLFYHAHLKSGGSRSRLAWRAAQRARQPGVRVRQRRVERHGFLKSLHGGEHPAGAVAVALGEA